MKVGAPPALTYEARLSMELRRMIREIRATLKKVSSAAGARALGRALKTRWSDERIREIVLKLGHAAEKSTSAAWKNLDAVALLEVEDTKNSPRKRYSAEQTVLDWVSEATKLITSVRDEVASQLEKDIIEAVERGQTAAVLQKKWAREGIPVVFGTLEGRVKVIAQHQMSMLHSKVQKARAEAVGVTKFIWRTQGDGRVRARHKELNGKEFDYDDPPASEGLPGQPINCRCFAESVIPDEMLSGISITRKV